MLLLLLPGVLQAAAVYRCAGEDGEPRFQQRACREAGGVVELPPPAARWDALRPAERRLLQEYRHRQRVEPAGSSGERSVRLQASERRCWEKRRRLERVAARLRRGYKASERERLRTSRGDLEEFLQRYCE